MSRLQFLSRTRLQLLSVKSSKYIRQHCIYRRLLCSLGSESLSSKGLKGRECHCKGFLLCCICQCRFRFWRCSPRLTTAPSFESQESSTARNAHVRRLGGNDVLFSVTPTAMSTFDPVLYSIIFSFSHQIQCPFVLPCSQQRCESDPSFLL